MGFKSQSCYILIAMFLSFPFYTVRFFCVMFLFYFDINNAVAGAAVVVTAFFSVYPDLLCFFVVYDREFLQYTILELKFTSIRQAICVNFKINREISFYIFTLISKRRRRRRRRHSNIYIIMKRGTFSFFLPAMISSSCQRAMYNFVIRLTWTVFS